VILDYTMHDRGAAILRTVEEAALVVLDDIATREPTWAQREALLAILDARAGRPMVLTGNLSIEQLAEVVDDRAASRICAGTIIEVTGKDRRLAAATLVRA
jgi:DNA replication protein DnaC